MKVKLTGIGAMRRNISKLTSTIGPKSYRQALIKTMLKVEAEAMRRTPVDTGKLRSSGAGNAKVIKSSPSGAKGTVSFTANYAVPVHERTDVNHKNGEAKFLHNAIVQELPKMATNIGVSINSTMFKKDLA